MFKGKLIELPQLEHPPLIYEATLLLMIICLFFPPTNHIRNKERGNIIQMCREKKGIKGITIMCESSALRCKNKNVRREFVLKFPEGEKFILKLISHLV